jgi:hypothetical protein
MEFVKKYGKGKESNTKQIVKLHSAAIVIQEKWRDYLLRKTSSSQLPRVPKEVSIPEK